MVFVLDEVVERGVVIVAQSLDPHICEVFGIVSQVSVPLVQKLCRLRELEPIYSVLIGHIGQRFKLNTFDIEIGKRL